MEAVPPVEDRTELSRGWVRGGFLSVRPQRLGELPPLPFRTLPG